jgi:hypothetical protein
MRFLGADDAIVLLVAVLQIGQALCLSIQDCGDPRVKAGVVAAVLPDTVVIRLPLCGAVLPASIAVGAKVTLRVAMELGAHMTDTSIKGVLTSPYVAVVLATPGEFKTVQQRKYFRLCATMPLSCMVSASSNKATVGKSDTAAMSQDLSSGGIRFVTVLAVEIGDKVDVALKVQSNPKQPPNVVKLLGTVKRVVLAERNGKTAYSVGLEFAFANRREEDAMVTLMMEFQRLNKCGCKDR